MTSLIKNHAAAEAIADFLAEGIRHPGDPETKQREATLVIEMFRAQGRPPPYDEMIRTANKTIGEAIVYLLESTNDCSIIPNSELGTLRTELDELRTELAKARDELAKRAADELTQLSEDMGLYDA